MRGFLLGGLTLVLLAGCGARTGPPATTAAPSTTTSAASVPVSFPSAGGAPVAGRIFGRGQTAVILSNMGDNDARPWEAFAPSLASSGYLVLTYSYRYPRGAAGFDADDAAGAVADLRGAAAYARRIGATRLVLIGASLGGILTGKLAGELDATAMVILSAPPELTAYGLTVTPAELASMTGPKLFVASEDDPVVAPALTRAFFDRVGEPKRWQAYPTGGHGVQLLTGPPAAELRQLLAAFLQGSAPPA